MLELLAKSKNNVPVYYDPVNSHAATHLEDTMGLKDLVKEAISNLVLSGLEYSSHIDMGRVIGACDVVNVNEGDEIVYGIRKNRKDDGLVPFVKNRQPEPCSTVALHLVPREHGSYILSSAWIGVMDPEDQPFPQSPNATDKSIEYTDMHAFIYGTQEIIEGTETPIKPW